MSIGFQSINIDNIVQIDDTYKNLTIIAEGTGTTGTTITFPTQTYQPLVAIGVTGSEKRWSLDSITTSSFALSDRSGAWIPVNYTFPYKVFGYDPLPLASNPHGLEIRDGSNNLVFNTNYRYFKLRHIIDINLNNFADADNTYPLSPMYSLTLSGLLASPYVVANGLAGIPTYKYWGTPSSYSTDYEAQSGAVYFGSGGAAWMAVGLESTTSIKFYNYAQYFGAAQNYNRYQTTLKLILGY